MIVELRTVFEGKDGSVDVMQLAVVVSPDGTGTVGGEHLLIGIKPSVGLVGNGNVGTQREALVAALLQEAGFLVNASKDETKGDFVITKKAGIIPLADSAFTIEVGGKDKERKSSDFVIRDNIDYATDGIIPLWLLAMMW